MSAVDNRRFSIHPLCSSPTPASALYIIGGDVGFFFGGAQEGSSAMVSKLYASGMQLG